MMRRKIRLLTFLLITVFTLSCVPGIFADVEDRADPSYFVYDDANLLTESQWDHLNQRAKEISDKYECSLYIVTVDDFTDYTNDEKPETAEADTRSAAPEHLQYVSRLFNGETLYRDGICSGRNAARRASRLFR